MLPEYGKWLTSLLNAKPELKVGGGDNASLLRRLGMDHRRRTTLAVCFTPACFV